MNLREFIDRSVRRALKNVLNENRIVTFNGRTYPNNGWCVVLSGGSGSGKGFVLHGGIAIDGKVIDVDKYKEYFVKMNGGFIDGEKYDSSNPLHVSLVHQKVKEIGWKDKERKNILNQKTHRKDMLPNVIFDVTGKDPNESVVNIVKTSKNSGYNNMLVWVVCNRSEAIIRNLQRSRTVSDYHFHEIHNSLMEDMPQFLKSPSCTEYIDDAWIVFTSTENIQQPEFTEDEKKHVAVRLVKTENGFEIDEETENRLFRYLGKKETNTQEPEVYLSGNEVKNKYGKQVTTTQKLPNWSNLAEPREKTNTSLKIDRTKVPTDLLRR